MLDDELHIETPERVELHYVLANVGNRFLAAAIDHLIQVAFILLVLLIAASLQGWNLFTGMSDWAAALAVLAVFVIIWGYFVAFETVWSGQTPGKRIMRLRVVREDGRPIRFFEAFVRNLLRLAVDMQPGLSYAIGVVCVIFSPRSKRVGDYVAGTVVMKERATEAPSLEEIIKLSELEQQRLEQAGPPPFIADTRLLTERELRAMEAFLKRRYELNEQQRAHLAARIALPISARLGVDSKQLGHEEVIEEVDRQRRGRTRFVD